MRNHICMIKAEKDYLDTAKQDAEDKEEKPHGQL